MKMFKTKTIHFALIISSVTSAVLPSYARADLDYVSPYTAAINLWNFQTASSHGSLKN
jgi:hypothetical protein